MTAVPSDVAPGPILPAWIRRYTLAPAEGWLTLFFVQGLKSLFGWRDREDELPGEWTAADQSQYIAGERADLQVGLWRRPQWPGVPAGRGALHEERWRRDGQLPLARNNGASHGLRNS